MSHTVPEGTKEKKEKGSCKLSQEIGKLPSSYFAKKNPMISNEDVKLKTHSRSILNKL